MGGLPQTGHAPSAGGLQLGGGKLRRQPREVNLEFREHQHPLGDILHGSVLQRRAHELPHRFAGSSGQRLQSGRALPSRRRRVAKAFKEPAHGGFRRLSRLQASARQRRKTVLDRLLDLRGVREDRCGKAGLDIVLGFGQAGNEAKVGLEGMV